MSSDQEQVVARYTTITKLEITTGGELAYVAYHPEIEDCLGQGDTPDEARESLAEATEMILSHLRQHHLPIPHPAQISYTFAQPAFAGPPQPVIAPGH